MLCKPHQLLCEPVRCREGSGVSRRWRGRLCPIFDLPRQEVDTGKQSARLARSRRVGQLGWRLSVQLEAGSP